MVNQTASDLPKTIDICMLLLKFLTIIDKSKICHSDLWLGNIGVMTTSSSHLTVGDLVLIDTAEICPKTSTKSGNAEKCRDNYSMLVSLFDHLVSIHKTSDKHINKIFGDDEMFNQEHMLKYNDDYTNKKKDIMYIGIYS